MYQEPSNDLTAFELLQALWVFMLVMFVLWIVIRVVQYGGYWLYLMRKRVKGSHGRV